MNHPYLVELGRMRRPAAALVAAGVVAAHLPASVGLPCPLRTLTGVPCPFCGLTTSVRAASGGHFTEAFAAAPLGVAVLAVAVAVVLRAAPARLAVPRWALAVGLGAEWVFELFRFHLVG